MGITGLLPFLEKASKRTCIDQFSGGTAAIDSYCWLHKGVFSCAEKLSMGQPTDAYVHYCMKFVYMLLSYKIKPILVFDGRHLPAKAQTEAKRRENRQTNRRKGIELMQIGQHAEARNLLRRSIDVTHEMALELIKECHKMNIDCIVAPYEADAQLAYLNISGIADVVITEDSDLILFGCKKVLFKMDVNGHGLLVDQEQLHLAMGMRFEHFSMDNFRYMCILSGCDYLSSLPGIGLTKARKFITMNTDCDIHRALTRLGSYLNMKSLVVTEEYRDSFILAVITFKHQLVFCPLKRKQVRLNPPMPDVTQEQLYYAGTETDPDIALQLALGNCDPFSLKILHNFDPDKMENQVNNGNTWRQKAGSSRRSIWSKEYKLVQNQLHESPRKSNLMAWCSTVNQETVLSTNHLKKSTIIIQKEDNFESEQLSQKEILDIYDSKSTMEIKNNPEVNILTPSKNKVSPVLIRRRNPFSKQSSNTKTSPSLLLPSKSRIKGRNMMHAKRTIIGKEIITKSQFFSETIAETNDTVIGDNGACPATNSNEFLLEKENIELGKNNQTNNINLQIFMVTDEVETNSQPMDIDEEHNASFALNKCENMECSNTSNLEKSHLDVSVNETKSSSINELNNLDTSLTPLEPDVDSDFLIQQGDITEADRNLFTYSDTKVPMQTNNKVKQNKRKSFSNARTSVNSKMNMTNSTRRSQQLHSEQRQQSLLSMYGFEKKKSQFNSHSTIRENY